MTEKTALYFMVDWLAAESRFKNYNEWVWISIITLSLSSFFNPIKADRIGEILRSFIAHKNRSMLFLKNDNPY
ncbi:MAG: hypothetical protein ACKVQV_16540 [Bacteroidia bacterium]